MKKTIYFTSLVLVVAVFTLMSCSSDDDKSPETPYNPDEIFREVDGFKIKNVGNGAVDTIDTESGDKKALKVIHSIPTLASGIGGRTLSIRQLNRNIVEPDKNIEKAQKIYKYPVNLPISFFFNDKIYISSLKNNVKVTMNGEDVKGTIVFNETADGFAVLTFTPDEQFKVDATIIVTLLKGITDKAGNEMNADVNLMYETVAASSSGFDETNLGFEADKTDGMVFVGDGARLGETVGPLSAATGNGFVAISTGKKVVTGDKVADKYTTSMVILGPIKKDISSVGFDYNFISDEFNEWVDYEFDDCFMMTVTGPKGSYSKMITSVKIIGKEKNNPFVDYPYQIKYDFSDEEYIGQSGWLNTTVNFNSVGSPAYITLTISDVADDLYTTLLAIDNVRY